MGPEAQEQARNGSVQSTGSQTHDYELLTSHDSDTEDWGDAEEKAGFFGAAALLS